MSEGEKKKKAHRALFSWGGQLRRRKKSYPIPILPPEGKQGKRNENTKKKKRERVPAILVLRSSHRGVFLFFPSLGRGASQLTFFLFLTFFLRQSVMYRSEHI